jgi:hypothetical protein
MDIRTQICPNPVFIIGSPRSGTSILGWSLAHHSRFWTSNESHILFDLYGDGHVNRAFQIAKKRHSNGWLNVQGVETAEYLQYAGLGLNALFTSRSEGKRWVDHTPLHTHMVETLGEMFPEAFFLHILRDGRSVVNSMVNFLDRSAGDDPAPAWVDFTEACRTWRRYTEIAMDFGARNPTRCLTVVNEELVAEPVEGFRKILRFLDAPNEEGPANYFRTNRINSSFGAGSREQAVRKRPSAPWREWDEKDRLTFYWEAGPTLIKVGFATKEELGSLAGIESDVNSHGAYKGKVKTLRRRLIGGAHSLSAKNRNRR